MLVARTILRTTAWAARSTRWCGRGAGRRNGGLSGPGITVLRSTASTGTPSRSATSFSTYIAPSQKNTSKWNFSRISARSVKWWSTWETKNFSSSKAISLGPLRRGSLGEQVVEVAGHHLGGRAVGEPGHAEGGRAGAP